MQEAAEKIKRKTNFNTPTQTGKVVQSICTFSTIKKNKTAKLIQKNKKGVLLIEKDKLIEYKNTKQLAKQNDS